MNRYTLRRTGRTDERPARTATRGSCPRRSRLLRGDPSGALVLSLGELRRGRPEGAAGGDPTRRVRRAASRSCRSTRPPTRWPSALSSIGRVELDAIAALLAIDESPTPARRSARWCSRTPTAASWSPPRSTCRATCAASSDRRPRRGRRTRPSGQHRRAHRRSSRRRSGVDDITAQLGAVWISAEVHSSSWPSCSMPTTSPSSTA